MMYTRETQELIYAILGDISNFFTGQEAGHSPHRLDLEQTKKQIKERFLEEYDLKPLKSPLVYFSKFLKENRYKTIKEAENKEISIPEAVADVKKDKFIILAGQNYLTPLQGALKHIETPLEGKKIGERLQFLSNKLK